MLQADMLAGQGDIAARHFQRRVAENLLQREHVATCNEVGRRECVAQQMGMHAGDSAATAQPLEQHLDRVLAHRFPVDAEEKLRPVERIEAAALQVARQDLRTAGPNGMMRSFWPFPMTLSH